MENKMSYAEFKEQIMDELAAMPHLKGELRHREVIKPNRQEMTGIYLDCQDRTPRPMAYLEEIYQEYLEHGDFDKTLKLVAWTISQEHPSEELRRLDFANCQDQLICDLVGIKQNQELLERIPHVRENDTAVIFRILLYTEEEGHATCLVNEEIQKELGMTRKAIYEKAMENTARLLPAVTMELGPNLTVLSNKDLSHGAICMLYPGALEKIAEEKGVDLYILPSSIHEVLAVPDDGELSAADLQTMVREANRTCVAPDELLTDSVYRYSREDGVIHRCKETPQRVR
ncbi:hypothetical protein D3Z38_06790 [Clostridiales bacterium]|nr:hypothetical protein [Clostridiales bacterium]